MGLTQKMHILCTFWWYLLSGDVPFIFGTLICLLKYNQQCEGDILSDINDSTLMATRLSFSCFLYIKMISHFQYANKWRRPVVTCWRQGRPMNEVISLIVLEHGFIAVIHLSVVCPIPPIPGFGKRGELTGSIGTCPHTFGTILHAYHPLHISYK